MPEFEITYSVRRWEHLTRRFEAADASAALQQAIAGKDAALNGSCFDDWNAGDMDSGVEIIIRDGSTQAQLHYQPANGFQMPQVGNEVTLTRLMHAGYNIEQDTNWDDLRAAGYAPERDADPSVWTRPLPIGTKCRILAIRWVNDLQKIQFDLIAVDDPFCELMFIDHSDIDPATGEYPFAWPA